MFDWNDEEFANVIWGESSESDDHIVPHPDESEEKPRCLFGDHIKKERKQEAANVKSAEQKKPIAKSYFHGSKLENNSQYDRNKGLHASGFGMDSWPDLFLSNAAKTDQDSMDETAQLENDSEIFRNHQQEDREESDFVDYSWANIGSFDDLDRIFSNSDPVFEYVRLGSADELWSSSKDVNNSPEKSIPLTIDSPSLGFGAVNSKSEHFETKAEYTLNQDLLDQDLSFTPGYEKVNDYSSHAPQNVQASMDHIGYVRGKSKLLVKDKTALEMVGMTPAFSSYLNAGTVATLNEFADEVNRQRKLSKKGKKSEEKSEVRQLENVCGTRSPSGNQFPQFDGQYAPLMGQPSPCLVLGQQSQLRGSKSTQYAHISNHLLAPSVYGNMGNPYPAMYVLPQFHPSEGNHQQVPSGYEVPPGNSYPLKKSADTPVKPLTMTPQEKIEKLRRRQQMRAILAIQKQQQQFSHQVSCTEDSISYKCSNDNQMQFMEGGDLEVDENLSSFHSLDPNSPIEQDGSNTVCMTIDNCSVEDTVLFRLQDIISKLDIQIRTCIRDSSFRLAQSAMQRQCSRDTDSTQKSGRDVEVLTKEEINSHYRFARMPDVETDTNPIDRTVAHLLFHRPLEFLGKLPEIRESPGSANVHCERKSSGLMSLPMEFWTDCSKSDLSKSSPCAEISENTSNTEAPDGGAMEVQVSR